MSLILRLGRALLMTALIVASCACSLMVSFFLGQACLESCSGSMLAVALGLPLASGSGLVLNFFAFVADSNRLRLAAAIVLAIPLIFVLLGL